MAVKMWQPIKFRYCGHAEDTVALEAELIYPADYLPDPLPRVSSHRCSHAMQCNLFNKPTCMWAGSNPTFDPFIEPDDEVVEEHDR